MLDRTKVPVSIDIGFGDIVYLDRVKMEFPTLLDMTPPLIYAYSLTSVIAEKFEAIVSLGYANSRFKDFYDIFLLSKKFDFDRKELTIAIEETFKHRNTQLDDIVAFESGFYEDSIRTTRWNAFIKKKRANIKVEFSEVAISVRSFLGPLVEDIKVKDLIDGQWSVKDSTWS